jgi:adenosylcobinamide-GDP ribazoletransferase
MSLGNALSYLTVIPIPYQRQEPLQRSVHFFPLVGAGMGSALVLGFVLLATYLPDALAVIGAVAGLEAMTGGRHLRAFAEFAEGRTTFAGHGFDSGFRWNWRGRLAVGSLLALKVFCLWSLPWEWQTTALLLAPILGRNAQTYGLVFSGYRRDDIGGKDPAIRRRRIRAVFLGSALLCLFFLFPWNVALACLGWFGVVVVGGFRILNHRSGGLTVQNLGWVAEMSEVGMLVVLAIAAFLQ